MSVCGALFVVDKTIGLLAKFFFFVTRSMTASAMPRIARAIKRSRTASSAVLACKKMPRTIRMMPLIPGSPNPGMNISKIASAIPRISATAAITENPARY